MVPAMPNAVGGISKCTFLVKISFALELGKPYS